MFVSGSTCVWKITEAPLCVWSANSPWGSNAVTWGGASGEQSALLFCCDAEALEGGGGDEELTADNPVRQ